MKLSGAIEQKFVKFFTNAETNSDELVSDNFLRYFNKVCSHFLNPFVTEFSKKIVSKYGKRLTPCFLLKFRNDYEIPVDLNDDKWIIVSISALYEDFAFGGGGCWFLSLIDLLISMCT